MNSTADTVTIMAGTTARLAKELVKVTRRIELADAEIDAVAIILASGMASDELTECIMSVNTRRTSLVDERSMVIAHLVSATAALARAAVEIDSKS